MRISFSSAAFAGSKAKAANPRKATAARRVMIASIWSLPWAREGNRGGGPDRPALKSSIEAPERSAHIGACFVFRTLRSFCQTKRQEMFKNKNHEFLRV
jgi:hypothetical protein